MKIEGFAIVSQGSPLARVRFGLLAFDAGDVLSTSAPSIKYAQLNISGVQFVIRTGAGK